MLSHNVEEAVKDIINIFSTRIRSYPMPIKIKSAMAPSKQSFSKFESLLSNRSIFSAMLDAYTMQFDIF